MSTSGWTRRSPLAPPLFPQAGSHWHAHRRGMDMGVRAHPHSCRRYHGENMFPATWDNRDIAQERGRRSQAQTPRRGGPFHDVREQPKVICAAKLGAGPSG